MFYQVEIKNTITNYVIVFYVDFIVVPLGLEPRTP